MHGNRKKQIRSPQEKKRLSYLKDRRNHYGENAKASRKAIPKRKALENKRVRRACNQELAGLDRAEDQRSELVESDIRHDIERIGGWKKWRDLPLWQIIEWKGKSSQKPSGRLRFLAKAWDKS